MALVTLEDFERDALPTLIKFAAIPALSPAFDTEWEQSGHLEAAAQLLASWARPAQPSPILKSKFVGSKAARPHS